MWGNLLIPISKKLYRDLIMGKKPKRSLLAENPAWRLSLIPLFGSPVLVIALAGIGDLINLSSNTFEIILCSLYPILIAVACFFICKTHPKSVWYTPIICNAYIIVPAFMDPNFWKLSFWTTSYWVGTPKIWMFHSSFILSVIGAIAGVLIGQRIMKKALATKRRE
jgi:hypothetical protein